MVAWVWNSGKSYKTFFRRNFRFFHDTLACFTSHKHFRACLTIALKRVKLVTSKKL